MSKYWVVGFTEAEGSFYLTKKGPSRIIHCFEITQKNDKIVLKRYFTTTRYESDV